MPSNPTTKSQVHAYKFVLRRMQSALVRRDAVMLHDPMRTHSRATMVGVVLSALGVLGFIIFSLFQPAPKPPGPGNIVIGESSGQIYVTTGKPMQLVPTFNMASARLLLMAQQNKGDKGPTKIKGKVDVKQASVVPDDQLVDIPRGKPTGIAFGPALLPTKDQRISAHWAVCENIELDPDLPKQEARSRAEPTTTVVAGMSDLGHELRNNEALLVRSPDSRTFLVYRLEENANRRNADVVRAKVDLDDKAVTTAYGLATAQPRDVSKAMLDAIPEVAQIEPPTIKGLGEQKWGLGLGVGEAFYVAESDHNQYYVLTSGGKQPVSKAVADLIRYHHTNAEPGEFPARRADQIVDIPTVDEGDESYLDIDEFPRKSPTILNPFSTPSACLGWQLTGEKPNREGHTTLYVGRQSPVPTNKNGNSEAVKLSQPSPDGYRVDKFYMPPGHAAVVRSVTSKAQFGKGPIQLVSTLGVRYGVPNVSTAKVLGLTPQQPAPESILRLLPVGKSLNVQNAQKTWPPAALNNIGSTGGPARGGAE